ncbi:MAG: DUF3489 domain-containing protein [Bryobacteraceae bacterium]|nr:DUF3489 domain-containing protein [Bryobacteraceae bacterium]
MFTIDNENMILAGASAEEAQMAGVEAFATQKELAKLAANWPASRLVETWNGFAGAVPFDDLKPVKKFTDRKTAVARIWSAIQRLNAHVAPQASQDEPAEAPATTEATPEEKAPKTPKASKKAKPKKEAAAPKTAREGSKTTAVLDLIRRPDGATLSEIMAATGWQKHSVRGFISGAVGKKMGLTVESSRREDGERVYRLAI